MQDQCAWFFENYAKHETCVNYYVFKIGLISSIVDVDILVELPLLRTSVKTEKTDVN
jgi:hypothetical protein